MRLIEPILVGPRERGYDAAARTGIDIARHPDRSMPRTATPPPPRPSRWSGKARREALMKGSLHTDELMARRGAHARPACAPTRRISHCFVMDVPGHADPLIITDAAVNIAPTLEDKVDIVQNAIDLAHALGFPRCGSRSCRRWRRSIPKVPSTIEAAALCKMADRGQITGGILDGPLALDNAISPEAAADQADRLAGRRPRQRAGGARPRGRQHAGQEPVVPGRRRCRRHRARRAGADHPDQPGRSLMARLASCAVASMVAAALNSSSSHRTR